MAKRKPHLDKYDYEKLLDDCKLIARSHKIVAEENNRKKRLYASLLTENLMTRLFRDIKEMHDIAPRNGRGYGGYLEEETNDSQNNK